MLRSQLLILVAAAAHAAIWPPNLQEYSRQGEARPVEIADPILEEYGVVAAESANYAAGQRSVGLSAWRFKDSTGAAAAAQATPGALVQGNYVLRLDSGRLSPSELKQVFHDLADFRPASPPTLPQYLPKTLTNVRYLIGPKSLAKFSPTLNPTLAGIELGLEAEVGEAVIGRTQAHFALLRYPTPQIARLKAAELGQGYPGATVKRSGPLVAMLWSPEGSSFDAAAAAAFLSPVEFQAVVTENEANPDAPVRDAAKMMLSIFFLAGVLLVACLLGGVIFGGLRIFSRRGEGATGSVQTLHLGD